ncbi:MAG: ATP-dependent zinc metalloprotease FtsH [Pirellulaceae bacterium]
MEKESHDDRAPDAPRKTPPRASGPGMLVPLVIIAIVGGLLFMWTSGPQPTKIEYSFFLEQLRAKNILEVELRSDTAQGRFKQPPLLPVELESTGDKSAGDKSASDKSASDKAKGDDKAAGDKAPGNDQAKAKAAQPVRAKERFVVNLPTWSRDNPELSAALAASGARYDNAIQVDPTLLVSLLVTSVMIGLFLLFWFWLRRQQNQMMGGGFLSSFGRSPARRYEASKQAVTFKDVAGIEGVKADLMEIVEFLRNPKKFQRLGGRVPKGVLLNGPPGTGKTLLARAVAGEAGVPFYAVNGSEFIQMFVGVGASRVRDLFKTAKENAPGIIFIDEIDAVGRQRGAGLGGGHDEREQTLNQILSEMDGFAQNDFVIVLAATNRPDVLDPALLRPGRFDRHVSVGRPTQKGRQAIFKVHTRDVPLADDVSLETLASGTIGLTGADIRNIVNEAALWAARQDKSQVEMADFDHARDKILMGPKREEVLNDREKVKTAYHEAGHTLLAWQLPGAHRVHKVTIVPRGRSLGSTHTLPAEDRLSISEPELRDHLAVLLAGRAAENLIYSETTVGAENDLERATGLARRMVMNWGMSDRLGPVSYKLSEDDPFLGREMHQHRQFSEHTLEVIDAEVVRILRESSERASTLLTGQRDKLEKLTQALLEKEELDDTEIAALIGPSIQSSMNGHGHGKSAVDLATSP